MYPAVKNAENWHVNLVDSEPNTSGLVQMDRRRDELLWISVSGAEVHRLNLKTGSKSKKSEKLDERMLAPFAKIPFSKWSVKRGSWELLKKSLYFIPESGDGQPLWNLAIADDLVSVEVDKDRSSWMGLSTIPNKLYHMLWMAGGRRDEALLETLHWDKDSELVAWVPCAEGRSLLLENKNGKVILNSLQENPKLRTLDWEGYAELNVAYATNMQARSCNEVYLTTTQGLIKASR